MVGEHDGDLEFAQQRDEFRRLEAVVPHLDDVAELAAVERAGQQFEKAAEIGLVEFLERGELPEQGAELVAELGHAGIEKSLDRIRRLRASTRRLVTKREPLMENTKPSGTSLAHLRKVAGVCVR